MTSRKKLGRVLLIAVVPSVVFIGCCIYEHLRWLWLLRDRRKILQLCYRAGVDPLLDLGDTDVEEEYLTKDEVEAEFGDCRDTRLYPKILGPSVDVFKDPGRQMMCSMIKLKGRFVNPFWEFCDRNPANFFRYLKWKLFRVNRQKLLRHKSDDESNDNILKVVNPDLPYIHEISKLTSNHSNKLVVTWLGQSMCYIQVDGYNILTDPTPAEVLVNKWVGQKRLGRSPCSALDLPSIDLVLVSHDHFDHLDRDIIKSIGNNSCWIIPIGLGESLLKPRGVHNYKELGWWNSFEFKKRSLNPLTITVTPAQHWSGTHFFNVNKSLWCSMFVKGKSFSFFHCGDSGYCSIFKEVKAQLGSPDLAILPIGTYEPRWYLKYDHMGPWEAAFAHKDLGAKISFGVHWGTYNLSDEPMSEPPRLLKLVCRKLGIPKNEFLVGHIGGTHIFESDQMYHTEHHKDIVTTTIQSLDVNTLNKHSSNLQNLEIVSTVKKEDLDDDYYCEKRLTPIPV